MGVSKDEGLSKCAESGDAFGKSAYRGGRSSRRAPASAALKRQMTGHSLRLSSGVDAREPRHHTLYDSRVVTGPGVATALCRWILPCFLQVIVRAGDKNETGTFKGLRQSLRCSVREAIAHEQNWLAIRPTRSPRQTYNGESRGPGCARSSHSTGVVTSRRN